MEEKACVVFGPAVMRLHQRDRRQVAVLSLAAHDTHRLIHQNRHLVRLLSLGLFGDLYARPGRDLHAHGRGLPVDSDPAARNPVVGLTP